METQTTKHPYLGCIIAGLFATFMTAIGMIISGVMKLDEDMTIVGGTISLVLSVILAFVFIRVRKDLSFETCGYRKPEEGSVKKVIFYIPLVLVEIVPLFAGLSKEVTIKQYLILLIFVIAVGFNEETYFRGIALTLLKGKGYKVAIFFSSAVFGILHLSNLLRGKDIVYLLLQVFFAFEVGVVLSEICLITKNLWLLVIWHAVHDYISSIVNPMLGTPQTILMIAQVVILAVYAVVLWKQVKKLEIK